VAESGPLMGPHHDIASLPHASAMWCVKTSENVFFDKRITVSGRIKCRQYK